MVLSSKTPEEQVDKLTQPEKAFAKWWALVGVGMGVLMFALDVYIVNISLPTLVKSLYTDFATIQWVVLVYLLSVSVMMLSAAKLGDMWSKKWLYLGGLILFTISSLLCGIAPTVNFLIGFRAMQGLGAAFIAALGSAIITEVFPKQERGRGLGIIGGIFLLGIALGPTVGGLLLSLGNWRLIFFVNVPIGLVASLIVVLVVPPSVNKSKEVASDLSRFDFLGVLIMTFTLICFALGMTFGQIEEFSSIKVIILLLLAALSFAVFLIVESRVSEPMLDLKMFGDLQLSLSLLLSVMVNMVIASVIFILPFFLELVKHYSTQKVGFLLSVSPMLAGLIAPVSGALSDRFSPRIISIIGLLLMVCGCLSFTTFSEELTVAGFMVRIAFHGLGLGMFLSPNNSAVMGAVPRERLGIASGLLSLSRTLGQTAGLPLVGALFSSLTFASAQLAPNMSIINAPTEALVFAVQMTFRIISPILIVSTGLAAFLWWRSESQLN